MSRRARYSSCLVALGVIALTSPGCLSDAELGDGQAPCPPLDDFRVVSGVLERRCGTLDCHGTIARPLRVYGQAGLRRPEPPNAEGIDFNEYHTGGLQATTDAEVYDNYLSACGLEPEAMDLVLQKKEDVASLTLIRKPRLEERHKGGRIWDGVTKGDKCITSWIAGTVDKEACRIELERP
jgi:hypothetical protein